MILEWRTAGFLLAVVLIWLAVASPLLAGDAHSLTVHMIQHLLLMSIAPPLIWLAEPLRAVKRGLPSLRGLVRMLDRPVVCWLAATAALAAWHVPAALTLTMHSPTWHGVELASFLVAGLLFWWPVVQPWPASSTEPRWWIVLYLFLATLPCDVLAGFLVFSERVVYPMYSRLEDQQLAGALMWTVVTIVYVVAGALVAIQAGITRPRKLRVSEPISAQWSSSAK